MSFALHRSGSNGVDVDFAPLVERYEHDASPIVRTAALRIAGFLGNRPGNLDLARLLGEERDPRILTGIVEARTLWTKRFARRLDGFELWEGYLCDWFALDSANQLPAEWKPDEIERLLAILGESSDSALRDAVSFALANRYRGLERNRDTAPAPVRGPNLRVHEWGVWRESGGTWDGPTLFSGPVRASWSDESRTVLLLSPAWLGNYPGPPSRRELDGRWWLSENERNLCRERDPSLTVFVLSVSEGEELRGEVFERLELAYLESELVRVPLGHLVLDETALRERLAGAIERRGLERTEADSLLKAWESEFFRAPGLRIVTILPQVDLRCRPSSRGPSCAWGDRAGRARVARLR